MAVYLLRFDRPLGDPDRPGAHASYYIGSTPDARLVQHLTEHWRNSDACIVRAARTSGRRFRLVRVWWGEGRPFERKLKRAGHYVRHDPAPPEHIPLTVREEPAPYGVRLPDHAGDGASGAPPVPAYRSRWACPVCKGTGRVRYTEPDPATGQRVPDEEPCEMCDGIGYPPHFAEPLPVYRHAPDRPARRRAARFPLGMLVATPGALALAREHGVDVVALLRRHRSGDWGQVPEADALANDLAADPACPARLLSAYDTPGGRLWIITEADRSATTVLLPSEY